jgi:16S rRNA U516 pseudouridylate synthase RsuA-like enzyme
LQKKEKRRVNEWINDNKNNLTGTFLETFDEVKKSGEYIVEDDGSELTVQSGQTSIYITYKKQ